MDYYSTSFANNSYSDTSDHNESYSNIEYYKTKDNSNEAEMYNEEFKRNSLKPNIGQLNAQIMNLPYFLSKESISNDEFEDPKKFSNEGFINSKKFLFEEFDIFKRIKEAYDACSCKICKCVMGKRITPDEEYCDCQPCNCKDCTLTNLRFKGLESPSGNKTYNKDHSNVKEIKCDCKPCECIECVQNCSLRSEPGYIVQKNVVVVRKMETSPTINNRHVNYPIQDPHFKSYNLPEHPSSVNKPHSNMKCSCNVCECLTRECQGTALTCSSSQQYGFCKCAKCKCQLCSHKKEPPPTSKTDCACELCHCVQCARESKFSSSSNNLKPDIKHEGSCTAPHTLLGCEVYSNERKPPIARIMRKKSLTYECNEYAKYLHSRAQSKTMNAGKLKQGNIFYATDENICPLIKTVLKPAPAREGENTVDILGDSKLSSKGNTVLAQSFPRNSHAPKNPHNNSKNCAASIFYACLNVLKATPMKKTTSCLLFPEFRSTQTITVPSSILSYENKGHCLRAISLPDTNIVDGYSSDTNFNQIRKHPIIYQFHIKTDSDIKLIDDTTQDKNGNNVAGNLLFYHFNKYFSKSSCSTEQTTKVDYDSVYKTIHIARQFRLKLIETLLKYEKANLEFKSVAKTLKKSLQTILNGPSNTNSDSITKKADSLVKQYHKVKLNIENEADTKPIRVIFSKFKNNETENKPVNEESIKQVVSISMCKQSGEDKVKKTRIKYECQDIIRKVRNENIDSDLVDTSYVYGTIQGQEPTPSKVELQRAIKIQNILQRYTMPDLFSAEKYLHQEA